MTLRITSAGIDAQRLTGGRRLEIAVALLMAMQAGLGLAFRSQYRDVEWIRATWLGNDWVTLLVAAPVLGIASLRAARGSHRWRVATFGLLAYAVYNYSYYLFGAALNVFFPLYVAVWLLALLTLLTSLAALDLTTLQVTMRRGSLSRAIGAYFVCVGAALASVWLVMWADFVVLGRPTPIETEAFKLVAALDLTLVTPLLIVSGVLLWRRRLSGCWIGAAAGIQSSMYLLVLVVNSTIAVGTGTVEAPGELPLWGVLALLTSTATLVLVTNIREAVFASLHTNNLQASSEPTSGDRRPRMA